MLKEQNDQAQESALTGVFVFICYWKADTYHMLCSDILERFVWHAR